MKTQNFENHSVATENEEHVPGYGELLEKEIRMTAQDHSRLSFFEKFVLVHGYLFKTEETLKAGYDRYWKAIHEILMTAEEFVAEVECRRKGLDRLQEVYDTLSEHVNAGRLTASDVFQYAVHGWCLRNPEAIVAYEEEDSEKWLVNNCDQEISEEAARVKVCEEWGFEASRIKIVGTPYYDTTDWQFIRFNCTIMAWLWWNGSLYKVYE